MKNKNTENRYYIGLVLCGMLLVALSGCDSLWNVSSRGDLKRHIESIAKDYGLVITNSTCNMFPGSRVGYCQFNAAQKDIDVFAQRAGLSIIKRGVDHLPNPDGSYPEDMPINDAGTWKVSSLENQFHCIQKCNFTGNKSLTVYGKADKYFHSEKGDSLDFYALYYDPVEGRACIVAGFKYG